jgi:TolB protein
MIAKSIVKKKGRLLFIICIVFLLHIPHSCRFIHRGRSDGAFQVPIGLEGSLQNPAWSPDGSSLVFTRFREGYNYGSADLYIIDINTWVVHEFATDGAMNVNLPGSAWTTWNNWITFSRDKDSHDEIFVQPGGNTNSGEIQITERQNYRAFEPSFSPASPSADWIVFESHRLNESTDGVIFKTSTVQPGIYIQLTASDKDCRQPNWSSADLILYQQLEGSRWSLWTMTGYGTNKRKITLDNDDCTDASFSHDGTQIIMSTSHNTLRFDNLYRMPSTGGALTRVTFNNNGYDGAPSWSPDGNSIAFESCEGRPEDADRTTIWIINLP